MAFNRPADVKPRVALAARKPVFHRKDEHRNMSKPVSERLADGIPQIRSDITTLGVEFGFAPWRWIVKCRQPTRSEEHTSELQSLMRISYAVFCLKKKKLHNT